MVLLPAFLVVVGASTALVLMLLAFSGPSAGRASARRLSSLRDRHLTGAGAPEGEERQLRGISTARATGWDRLAGTMLPNRSQLNKRLDRTGKGWTIGQYGGATLIVVLAVALLLAFAGAEWVTALALAVLAGLTVPRAVVGIYITRRSARFTARFPDAIDLLVRGLRSGLPVAETMAVVGQEIDGPVGEEFRAIGDKIKIGRTLDAALQDSADRLDTPEFRFFTITIAIQRETGGNLAETLSNLADVLRKRAQMRLKIKAMSSEGRASAMIVGALPFIVFALIWSINNGYMVQFFTDSRLMLAGLCALVWMAIGALIMARMVRFEI